MDLILSNEGYVSGANTQTLNLSCRLDDYGLFPPTLPNFTTMTQQLKEYCQELCDTLTERFNEEYPNSTTKKTFSVKKGRKYYKIVEDGSSAHAFIDIQTGDVFKPASWNKPADKKRYNLLNDSSRKACLTYCDWAGSYLYIRG